jgi:integrase
MMAHYELGVAMPPIDWNALMLEETAPRIRTRTISIEEESRIRALPEFQHGYGPAFSFALLSGIPLGAIVSLTWSQIDLTSRCVAGIKYRGHEYSVCIDSEMERLLLNELDKDPIRVFTHVADKNSHVPKTTQSDKHGRRRPITLAGFTSWFIRMREKVNLDIRISDLRKTAARRFYEATGNPKATRQFLGLRPFEPWREWNRNIPASEMVELQEETQAQVKRQRVLLEGRQSGAQGGSNDVGPILELRCSRLAMTQSLHRQ